MQLCVLTWVLKGKAGVVMAGEKRKTRPFETELCMIEHADDEEPFGLRCSAMETAYKDGGACK
jgi:hypothetical protein